MHHIDDQTPWFKKKRKKSQVRITNPVKTTKQVLFSKSGMFPPLDSKIPPIYQWYFKHRFFYFLQFKKKKSEIPEKKGFCFSNPRRQNSQFETGGVASKKFLCERLAVLSSKDFFFFFVIIILFEKLRIKNKSFFGLRCGFR